MANYVDGFVVPVPIYKIDDYRKMAEEAGKIWLEHGALHFVESIADDVKAGEVTSFPQAVQLKDGETVAFSWIIYESREVRDAVNAKVMDDPRLKAMMENATPPFDSKRMFFGGFTTIVELSR
ncbi:RNA signal recognition particle 4.5S RNA [Candidatus Burkholderia pumila]|uniref:RNA signal recognition particle 4.5S RNA n=1 Tax=Candidatus Burkholderia pumila TaxID=1090375 RepID=A0ABR5HP85_9BURK|nr:RNA signal recognition particle 4.5S RNA [Candidatus Burkholderia pumila]